MPGVESSVCPPCLINNHPSYCCHSVFKFVEVKFLYKAFELAPLDLMEYGIAIGLGFTIIPIVEIVKLIQRLIEKKKAK